MEVERLDPKPLYVRATDQSELRSTRSTFQWIFFWTIKRKFDYVDPV
jgi:hypothetical protein